MARLNVTYQGQNGDMPDLVEFDLTDQEIRTMAAEAVSGGGVPGIAAYPNAAFTNFKVDRFPATEEIPYNRLMLRPKTEYGKVVTLSFKTPDVLDEVDEEYRDALKKWVEYGEYVHIDFDLDAGTAKVREVR